MVSAVSKFEVNGNLWWGRQFGYHRRDECVNPMILGVIHLNQPKVHRSDKAHQMVIKQCLNPQYPLRNAPLKIKNAFDVFKWVPSMNSIARSIV